MTNCSTDYILVMWIILGCWNFLKNNFAIAGWGNSANFADNSSSYRRVLVDFFGGWNSSLAASSNFPSVL